MAFCTREALPGVYHIQDCMGVCMTLLVGERTALLVDTGYGLEDVQAYIRTQTALPLEVVLTHGHHDHCLGARWFERTYMLPADEEDFRTYTGEETRRRILDSARAKGIAVEEQAFLDAEVRMPAPLQARSIDLGGMTAEIIPCPGHTPGSCVVYVPERSLLLSGDDWNPCTWLFFPAALGVWDYRDHVRELLKLPFEHVLCSHQPALYPRETIHAFLTGLTDSVIFGAHPVKIAPYQDIDTRQADLPEGQILVFDWAKAQRKKG